MKKIDWLLLLLTVSISISAKEYHIAKTGNDRNPGTSEFPFLTIQAAASISRAGDTITVHEGVYRERITPHRGGDSEIRRIVYRVAEGEKAEIKGSEIIRGWTKLSGSVWQVVIPNTFFKDYNPFTDIINGDWFNNHGRVHHTGEVYLNGKSLWESATFQNVLNPVSRPGVSDIDGSLFTWFCESDQQNTYLYANFQLSDPNRELTEINVRNSCFYPDTTGINFITIRGFRMSQAATQWAAPTAEQIGLIGTFWSKGWIIEDNVISDSKCSGITLGKDRKSGHNVWNKDPGKDGSIHYNEVIDRVLADGWSKEKIGSHIVRNNTIFNCEQTGICGSLGGVFSIIENNNIFNIWTKRQFSGAEIAGIKIHASIDMIIRNNRMANCGRGLWLDWMAQGTQVTGNLLYNNTTDDIFLEVDHGPFLIANNFFLSEFSLRDWSEGGAYVHNLFAGNIEVRPQNRLTPYHQPHSTQKAGICQTKCGDNRFYNNILIGGVPEKENRFSGLKAYNISRFPMYVSGNMYLNNAGLYDGETNCLVLPFDPGLKITEEKESVYITIRFDKQMDKLKIPLISTQLLGKALIPVQGYENPDGSTITIDNDYFGKSRRLKNPTVGPVESPGLDTVLHMKVWP